MGTRQDRRTRPRAGRRGTDRGAAAVEFAIVLPLLLLLTGGIVDFGRAFHDKVVIANAAREGARMASMGVYTSPQIEARVADASVGVTETTAVGSCSAANPPTVTVTVTRTDFEWTMLGAVNGFFGSATTLPTTFSSSATMRCE